MPGLTAAPQIAVALRTQGWCTAVPGAAARCRRAAAAALAVGGRRTGPVEISIVLADDEFVRGLNRDWRGRDAPTNVLAFASEDAPFPAAEARAATAVPVMLGDVVVALETLLAESTRESKTAEAHLAHLVVHGVLHLLGFDHQDDAEAEAMEAAEIRALAQIGIENPYAGPHPSDS